MQLVKVHEKTPPKQTIEKEIGSLPEKVFRIMIVKMTKILKAKWNHL